MLSCTELPESETGYQTAQINKSFQFLRMNVDAPKAEDVVKYMCLSATSEDTESPTK